MIGNCRLAQYLFQLFLIWHGVISKPETLRERAVLDVVPHDHLSIKPTSFFIKGKAGLAMKREESRPDVFPVLSLGVKSLNVGARTKDLHFIDSLFESSAFQRSP